MSDPAVGDDESILNEVNSAEEPIDLDEDTIAELLGDNAVVSDNQPAISDDTQPADEQNETVQAVEEEMVIEEPVDDNILCIQSDGEVIEEIVVSQENGTRKRSIVLNSEARSPKPKRSRPASTYLSTRKSVSNYITKLLGSYDRMLHIKGIQQYVGIINGLARTIEEQVLTRDRARIDSLEKENRELRQALEVEKGARAVINSRYTSLREELVKMNKNMKEIYANLPLPTTPEITDCLFGRKMLELSQAQIARHEPPAAPVIHVIQPSAYSFGPRQRNMQNMQVHHQSLQNPIQQKMPIPSQPARRQTIHPSQLREVVQQQQIHRQEVRRSLPMAQHQQVHVRQQVSQQRSQVPAWPSLPLPTSQNAGHVAPGTPGPHWELIDGTLPNTKIISIGVPLIPYDKIVPIPYDEVPLLPAKFEALIPNPDVELRIKSSIKDFRETWQLAGRICYEKLPRVDRKCIQLFIQVASFKTQAIIGKIGRRLDEHIDWGVSRSWDCLPQTTHRFRLIFHKSQLIPHRDRIAIIAMIKDNDTGLIEMSEPTYFKFE